ncbi:TPR repeat-containing protein [Fulvivirga imtechensis AK7]|uniref:TPR repeat-containing protein n=1 Tax=Fulvivirga imtechensis AK7 TaxID=1237149 RepID=L8JTQ8_9BACT|nr:tetratricopeptide repeat protein [Fulvivirga imtechensis]ELR70692.1 TPR repeat-containing protein [Fulvivirga imtechensis AK7]
MNAIILSLGLLVCLPSLIYSQAVNSVDSLENLLSAASDSDRIEILSQLCWELKQVDTKKAIQYGEEAYTMAEARTDIRNMGNSHCNLGIVYAMQGNYHRAQEYFLSSISYREQLSDTLGLAYGFKGLGNIHQLLKEFDKAVLYFKRSLELYERKGSVSNRLAALNNLGLAYKEWGEYDSALKYYDQRLDLARSTGEKVSEASVLNNIAGVYLNQRQFKNALFTYQQSLRIKKEIGDIKGEALVLGNIGELYFEMDNVPAALDYFFQSLDIRKSIDYPYGVMNTSIRIAKIYLEMKNTEEAIRYAWEALELAKKINMVEPQKESLQILSEAYEQDNNYAAALIYFNQYSSLKDSLLNLNNIRKMIEAESRYEQMNMEKEVKLMELELSLKNQELRKKKGVITIIILSIGMVVVIGIVVAKHQQNRIQRHRAASTFYLKTIQNLELEEGKLKNELERKRRELTTMALDLVQRSNTMKEVRKELSVLSYSKRTNEFLDKLSSLQKMVGYACRQDKNWEDFKVYFENVHQNFLSYLKSKYPKLTGTDLKICTLSRLNFSIKEMAEILHISPESVKIARHRLRKRLSLDTNEELNSFIIGIEMEKR